MGLTPNTKTLIISSYHLFFHKDFTSTTQTLTAEDQSYPLFP